MPWLIVTFDTSKSRCKGGVSVADMRCAILKVQSLPESFVLHHGSVIQVIPAGLIEVQTDIAIPHDYAYVNTDTGIVFILEQ